MVRYTIEVSNNNSHWDELRTIYTQSSDSVVPQLVLVGLTYKHVRLIRKIALGPMITEEWARQVLFNAFGATDVGTVHFCAVRPMMAIYGDTVYDIPPVFRFANIEASAHASIFYPGDLQRKFETYDVYPIKWFDGIEGDAHIIAYCPEVKEAVFFIANNVTSELVETAIL